MSKFKQAIHIEGKCLEDIFHIPCVKSVEKTSIAGIFKFRFYSGCMAHPAPLQCAYTGDWLYEDLDGKWHVINEDGFQKLIKDE